MGKTYKDMTKNQRRDRNGDREPQPKQRRTKYDMDQLDFNPSMDY